MRKRWSLNRIFIYDRAHGAPSSRYFRQFRTFKHGTARFDRFVTKWSAYCTVSKYIHHSTRRKDGKGDARCQNLCILQAPCSNSWAEGKHGGTLSTTGKVDKADIFSTSADRQIPHWHHVHCRVRDSCINKINSILLRKRPSVAQPSFRITHWEPSLLHNGGEHICNLAELDCFRFLNITTSWSVIWCMQSSKSVQNIFLFSLNISTKPKWWRTCTCIISKPYFATCRPQFS